MFFTYKKVKYNVIDDATVSVAENKKFVGPLMIPETVEKNGIAYKVIALEKRAFSRSGITSVVIPGSIKKIADYAFSNTSLEAVVLGEGTAEIGNHAFDSCNISSVVIPSSVRTIGDGAFYKCSALEDVSIVNPETISRIGASAFEGTLWQAKTNSLIVGKILVNVGIDAKVYKIPEGVMSISPDAFINCPFLKEVTIPEGITKLSVGVFNKSTSIERVYLPSSLKSLSADADRWSQGTFNNCSSLTEIIIPDGVEEIGANCFKGCRSLEKITIPETVIFIGSGAFCGCSALKEITIPEGIAEIQLETFSGCSSLTSVHLPNSLTKIDEFAFRSCYRLSSIILPKSLREIGQRAFWECYNLKDIVLPEGLEQMREGSFGCCNSLTSIKIPDTVEIIEKNAFWSCYGLREVDVPQGVALDESSVFSNCPNREKKARNDLPAEAVIEISSDPFECDCYINLSEAEVSPYMSNEYSDPSDAGYDSNSIAFVEWGRYRRATLDDKEISLDSLFHRPMEYWGTQWEDYMDDFQKLLSALKPDSYGVIDRREKYKYLTVFHINLNGAPFNKYCLKMLKINTGYANAPIVKLIPSMSMTCNKLMYCGAEIEGEYIEDSGDQGKLQRIVIYKGKEGYIKIIGEYTYV